MTVQTPRTVMPPFRERLAHWTIRLGSCLYGVVGSRGLPRIGPYYSQEDAWFTRR